MENRTLLVSIIIPAYNSESTIRKTLESAVGQTWPNKEIIVVDDGSTDQTIAVAESFVGKYPVKIYKQQNRGACKARNVGFLNSSGDYIQYLDADDLLSPDKIKNQMKLRLDNEDCIVFSSRLIRFYNDEALPLPPSELRQLETDWNDPIEWLLNEWEGRGMGQTSLWLTPRKLIDAAGPWDERLLINQDGEFFSRVLLASKGIRFCKDSFVYYRSGNVATVSQRKDFQKAESLLLSIQLYKKNILPVEDTFRVRRALASKFLTFVYGHYDDYPAVVKEATNEVRALRLEKLPQAGGRNFRLMARVIGFYNALKLRSVLRSGKSIFEAFS